VEGTIVKPRFKRADGGTMGDVGRAGADEPVERETGDKEVGTWSTGGGFL